VESVVHRPFQVDNAAYKITTKFRLPTKLLLTFEVDNAAYKTDMNEQQKEIVALQTRSALGRVSGVGWKARG
jgi:hypothetical protein